MLAGNKRKRLDHSTKPLYLINSSNRLEQAQILNNNINKTLLITDSKPQELTREGEVSTQKQAESHRL